MDNTRYNAEAEIEKCRSIIKQYKTCLKNENERLQDVYDTCKLLMHETARRMACLPLEGINEYDNEIVKCWQELKENQVLQDRTKIFLQITKDTVAELLMALHLREDGFKSLKKETITLSFDNTKENDGQVVPARTLKLSEADNVQVKSNVRLTCHLVQELFASSPELVFPNGRHPDSFSERGPQPAVPSTETLTTPPIRTGFATSADALKFGKKTDIAAVRDIPTCVMARNKALSTVNYPRCFMDLEIDREPIGRVVIQLRPDKAPIMCQNFIKLCTEPGGYIGTKFFSMTSDKMVLGGDNETNDGTGGTSGFQGQKTIVADQGDLKDCRGALRMTFVEKTSDGRVHVASQFRIWLNDVDFKEYKFTLVIGQVVEGLEYLVKVGRIPMLNSGTSWKAKKEAVIVKCGIFE